MQESSLHAVLKDWYTQPGDRQEAQVDGYLIDVVRENLLIEIQTVNFAGIKTKLAALLESYSLCLVYPIAQEKWIVKLAAQGNTALYRRKSPKRGRLEHVFSELVYIPHLMADPKFSLEVLLIQEEEIRCDDGRGSWRRRGVSIIDHRLIKALSRHTYTSPDDFRSFLPLSLHEPFTTRELAGALKISRRLAGRMAYSMRAMGILAVTGKRDRALLYVST